MKSYCKLMDGAHTLAELGRREPRKVHDVLEKARLCYVDRVESELYTCAICGISASCEPSRALMKEAVALVKLAEDEDPAR
ncbi:MAG: hypothetical protein A2516_01415 [Alphaproteobacteria bacterium RIFOXYD12_FULL_60_8]|nr:MAG: hypothetical protein A2516_01415 [Alphaproteobacteria bacterium RIFOXYD12_FULL_60_8]